MSKKLALGKGLGALIPEEQIGDINEGRTTIPINLIKANAEQPRKVFDEDKIFKLSQSIKEHGIIQPLILKRSGESYIIIAGERRWRAAKLAGIKEIPAIIMDLTDKEVLEISLIENLQREDLNPIEEANAYKKLMSEFSLTQEELSTKVGRSRAAIANTIRLLNLDIKVQQYVIEGVITEGHARTLLSLSDKNLQFELAQKIIDEDLTVRDIEKLIKNLLNTHEDKKINKKELLPYYNDIRMKLEGYFGTKVNINAKKNKGKIEIEYYSEEDLQRILDIMNI